MTDCLWETIGNRERCTCCGLELPQPVQQPVRHRCLSSVPMPTSGPGTELTALLTDLNAHDRGCGSCAAYARQMDRWGTEGCQAHRGEIVDMLRAKIKASGLGAKIRAAKNAAKQGLWFNPLDPAPGLVDEAIRRAEAARLRQK